MAGAGVPPSPIEERLRAFLEAVPDAIVGVSAEGTISLVNAQVEALFGYTREELVGQPVEMLVPEAARGVHRHHREGYVADPHPRPMGLGRELAARRKDGSQFPAEISLSATATETGPIVWAAIRDVTERLEARLERDRLAAQHERDRLEAQLHQSQRLESLGQLAGGVAHDFNNLLAAILNYATFVAEEISEQACSTQVDGAALNAVLGDVAQIKVAAQRAARLTQQLLAFGRRDIVNPEVLDLNDIVRDVENLLRRTLGEHIVLLISCASDLSPVRADRGQLEQVLVNLAVNARDAMPGGGTLTMDTANVRVDEAAAARSPGLRAGDHVRLRVADTGAGMDETVLRHAFEPFWTTKPKGEGSGLGLATVYGIVTQAGGGIEIESEVGRGTAVTILLPAVRAPLARGEVAAGAGPRSAGETVLVVEDEESMREVTRRILARNGYRVITAANGSEALHLLERPDTSVDLVLTDLVMPGMSGEAVAERVRAGWPATRILYMSGYADSVAANRTPRDDGIPLVPKPFTEASLLDRIRAVLGQVAHRSAGEVGEGAVKVLIVDDHELVARSFARVLRDENDLTVVGVATSVADALAAARVARPDVVLMDYQLGDGDGVGAARQIWRDLPEAKVVILTGSGNAAAQVAASAAGCQGYLEKTRASEDIAQVIRRVHAGERIIAAGELPRLPTLDALALHYQPIVDLQSGVLVGVEALVRWRHPTRGMLPPRDFIGLAEESGFINEIGAWVFQEAARQLADWRRRFPRPRPLEMGVNVSALQLQQGDFVRNVRGWLDTNGVHEGLLVEITETAFLDGADEILACLQQLRESGARIALDDFGTGYSSLAYLRRFPIDVIKMDKVFTDDLPHGTRSLVLADTICALSRELDIPTVAEGIETDEQAACLRGLGASQGQGYHFGRPVPARDIERLLA